MNHLELLRNEHVQLQVKYAELLRKYDILETSANLASSSGSDILSGTDSTTFVKRLVETVGHLYNKDLYSDITIHVDGHQLRGHRFVLAARTDFWSDLSTTDRIELEGLPFNLGQVLMRWIYTDFLDDRLGDSLLLGLMDAAIKYQFSGLKIRCEALLIARVEVSNCVKIYQFAENHGLERLRDFCAEIVASQWKDFQPEHFQDMDASLLYKMLKRRSKHVLNSIIRLKREDVLFLYFVENDLKLTQNLNEPDEDGLLPLELAFQVDQLGVAKSLTDHGADVNRLDPEGLSFLWKAIQKGSMNVCEFLVENGANTNFVHDVSGETLLHVLAKHNVSEEISQWANHHITRFELNAVDKQLRTPLMIAIEHENSSIFNLLISQPATDVDLRDVEGRTALEIALLLKKHLDMSEDLVVKKSANLNLVNGKEQTLFHKAVISGDFAAIQFLAKHSADVNRPDANGSTPLHIFLNGITGQSAISSSQLDILRVLLKSGADPSLREICSGSTPIHFAVERDKHILELLLGFCDQKVPLDVLDKDGKSPLWRALLAGKFDAARLLLAAGANVNEKSVEGEPLLIRAIGAKRDDITRFLLDNKAIAAITSPDGFTCLNLAVENGLTPTVDYLCKLGANLNHPNPRTGLVPLWTALENGDYGTAEVLVGNGCDTEGWAPNEDATLDQTLLHRAIDRSNQKAAVFLIKNGCNVNALRTVRDPSSPQQQQEGMADIYVSSRQAPLHLAVQWGLTDVSKALISNLNCKTDVQDADGRTAAHIAVLEQDQQTLELLLTHPDPSSLSVRDRYGQTPLALAMRQKNNKAAEAICRRLPHAAVQVNGSGENLLHCAVKASDLESVLFLLGIQVDVNIPTQDQEKNTALHLCGSNELILRNLLLAGANVNTQNIRGQTPLHIAARDGQTEICQVLLENGADPNLVDVDGNNVLHCAVSHGAVKTVQMLLLGSSVDFMAVNKRRQNILHICAINVGIVSAELFITIMEIHPDYPLEMQDAYGNTMFLLSFLNGNSELCRLALRDGACMGVVNHQGQSVFNIDTPTKQLLFGLLDGLDREPRWAEGEFCSECDAKFTITMRKHHCRHCGRLVCAKCSEQQMPILKYNLAKNVRVCQICYDVLTMGVNGAAKPHATISPAFSPRPIS